jgi:hypothetical protein
MLSMNMKAQYIIEQNMDNLVDTVLFSKVLVKANKIRKCTKITYYFHGNNRMRKKKQMEEVWEYNPDGLLEFYSERPLSFRTKKRYSAVAYGIRYDSEGHATEYHEYKGYKPDSTKTRRSIYTSRLHTDSGILVKTRIFDYGDTFDYIFLINETANTRKVIGGRYYDYFSGGGYLEIKSDTGSVFYVVDENGNIDSTYKAVYSCTYNQDSTIQTCHFTGDMLGYGERPVDVVRWYHYIIYTWPSVSRHKTIDKVQIGTWNMIYFDYFNPIPIEQRNADHEDVPFPRIAFKVKYREFETKYYSPWEQLSFKKLERDRFYFDVPDELARYTYEFYP